ncbi:MULTISPECIES: hypothetical protein [unclassified Kitasatospora]|uniref:hypothetical protein n=1 Tax=unclassified Kitasatospora TaxID=2633591 RepID=UPI000708DB3C|nr:MULTISPECIES: hypothetical protein [unclassified Kitasatospora]KQV17475.1 hypothetical protein ASC99_25180 [Kitasatospora sp. Root107]KRB69277.1 hypothetical protein ASE03_27995 [Kitasatospora sp. Root187]
MTADQYVTVDLNGGTKETALDVFRALGGAFTPQPSTDAFLTSDPSSEPATNPITWARSFLVDGPGRQIGADHHLIGEITAEITGGRERTAYVLDALRAIADVDELSTNGRGTQTRTTVHLRPA